MLRTVRYGPLQSQLNEVWACPRQLLRSCSHGRHSPQRVRRHRIHTKTVTDDDIARLAALPLHPLTLADLVKSVAALHIVDIPPKRSDSADS
jgi:predicted amidohydrolase YtcJ